MLLTSTGSWLSCEWSEDVRDVVLNLEGMAKWSVKTHFVDVVPPLLVANDITSVYKVRDNAVNRAFADSNESSDVYKADLWVLSNA